MKSGKDSQEAWGVVIAGILVGAGMDIAIATIIKAFEEVLKEEKE